MNTYRQPASVRAALAAGRVVGRVLLPGRVALAVLIALSLLALGAIAVPDHALAGSGNAKITFAAPIYAGQNNGFAEGPVGTDVTIQGSDWAPGSPAVQITLADEQNDTSGQAGSACLNGGPKVSISDLAAPIPDGSGNFTASFVWPAAAAATGHSYWVCGQQGSTVPAGVDKFTVLSSNPPSLTVSDDSQAFPGGSVTVSGQNWLPGNQQINVVVTPCLACDPGFSSSATATSAADGSLTVKVGVPTQANVGNQLYVIAVSGSAAPDLPPALTVSDPSNAPRFTVVAQSSPTPTPTAAASPSPTVGVTATSSNSANGAGGGNSSGSNSTVLILILVALGIVLLVAAGLSVLLFLRSRPAPAPPTKGGPPPYGGGYGPPRGPHSSQRRTRDPYAQPSYPPPSYSETNADYYDGPPPRSGPQGQRWGNTNGWQDNPQGPEPDDGSGDDPTVGMRNPWR